MNHIKGIIESLSKVFCPRLGIVLEPAMGETHAQAGVGRPQGKINPWVMKCDLYIGVFKRRMGTPTGEYESGSEEEFTLAFNRNVKSAGEKPGVPEIILFFLETSIEDAEVLEPQLLKLLKFKEDESNSGS